MTVFDEDKLTERQRYDARARELLYVCPQSLGMDGAEAIPLTLRAPYKRYATLVASLPGEGHKILEIGAGTGLHTGVLLRTGADVTATDISENCLAVLRLRFHGVSNLSTEVADMERLPFGDESFDAVTSAGSLSYGDPDVVLQEIVRVLKPGGKFLCVDSLGHNPIYRVNRWIHYLRGERTKKTLSRIPTLQTIDNYAAYFESVSVDFFGSISWVMPLCAYVMGEAMAASFSDWVDRQVGVKRSAFKFVMLASGRR